MRIRLRCNTSNKGNIRTLTDEEPQERQERWLHPIIIMRRTCSEQLRDTYHHLLRLLCKHRVLATTFLHHLLADHQLVGRNSMELGVHLL